jgi:hypothetical protein
MPELAASAVRALCPYCERPVRSGVELSTELAGLAEAIAAVGDLSHREQVTAHAVSVARFGLAAVQAQLAVFRSEAAGVHLGCAIAATAVH